MSVGQMFGQTTSPLVTGDATVNGQVALDGTQSVNKGFVTYTNLADTTMKFSTTIDDYGLYTIENLPTDVDELATISALANISSNKVEVKGLGKETHTFNALTKNELVKYAIVYNILGQKVKELSNSGNPGLMTTTTWNGTDEFGSKVADGVYLIALGTNNGLYRNKFHHFKGAGEAYSTGVDQKTIEFFAKQAQV